MLILRPSCIPFIPVCTTRFNIQNFLTLCAECMQPTWFVIFSEPSAIIVGSNINIILVPTTEWTFCLVGIEIHVLFRWISGSQGLSLEFLI